MRKISKINWNRYKESESGKATIELFNKLSSEECSHEFMIELIKRFDPQFMHNCGAKEIDCLKETLSYHDENLNRILSQEDVVFESIDDLVQFYPLYLFSELAEEGAENLNDIPQSSFKMLLSENLPLSLLLYAYIPEFYLPNLFVMQFAYLKRIADKYEIELPETPNRSDYRSRCLYYIDMCVALHNFCVDNEFEDKAEFCAFLFDYEMPLVKEELEDEFDKPLPEFPEQAWILVGNYSEGEKNMERGFWQANPLTCKGDIMLFYEKSPVKKLNSVWIALQDGVVDPFFYYYSNTFIGKKIEIPSDMALTFEDFKNNDYFKTREKKGNFVSKNFQDVSGWPVTSVVYKEIKSMLEGKGFDTSVLPSLYEPMEIRADIHDESDVSTKLLTPLLEEMGWKKGVDFRGEIEFNAGHTKTGHKSNKRPDFCLHIKETDDDIEAKVAIEVKHHMKDPKQLHKTFVQGRSYAKWGNVQVLVLCDELQIRVYERDRNGAFSENRWTRFRWEEMERLEKFNELKRMLNI